MSKYRSDPAQSKDSMHLHAQALGYWQLEHVTYAELLSRSLAHLINCKLQNVHEVHSTGGSLAYLYDCILHQPNMVHAIHTCTISFQCHLNRFIITLRSQSVGIQCAVTVGNLRRH